VFKEEFIEKEINNVNSEISFKIKENENFVYYKLSKFLSNKDSNIFNDGLTMFDSNIDKKDLTDKIKKFHAKYYTGNLTTLVIISNLNKIIIEKEVREKFKD